MQCEECGSTEFVDDEQRGDSICKHCGMVSRERLIDFAHEDARTFSADRSAVGAKEDKSRTTPKNDQSGTQITFAGDRNPNSKKAGMLAELSKSRNPLTYKEGKLSDGRKKIINLCIAMDLSKAVQVRKSLIEPQLTSP